MKAVDISLTNGDGALLTNFFHCYRIQKVLIAVCDRDGLTIYYRVRKGRLLTRQQNKKLLLPVWALTVAISR